MSYVIYTSSGTVLTTIPTGKINTSTTSLTLIGRDVPNYGRYVNQNLVDMLSSFANSSNRQPRSPLVGQLWFDTTNKKLKVFEETGFKIVNKTTVSSNQPIGQESGEFWFDTTRHSLNVLDNTGQYQTINSFPRNEVSGWRYPFNPIYDEVEDIRPVALLECYGEYVGALSTASFIASADNSLADFGRAQTSEFEITEGLTIIGNVRATDIVMSQTGTFSWGMFAGNVNLGHNFLEVIEDLNLNVPDKVTLVGYSTTASPVHVVLPEPSVGKYLIIKDEGGYAGTNPIVIVPAATTSTATVINGDCLELQLNTNYGSYLLYSDGNNWFTVGDTYNFSLSSIQEGAGSVGGSVTSITGHHDTNTGVGLTSQAWAQLMWVPNTEFISTYEIAEGPSQYNWAYVSQSGLTIQNKPGSSNYSWQFDTDGLLSFPGADGFTSKPLVGDVDGDGGFILRGPIHSYTKVRSYNEEAYISVVDSEYDGISSNASVKISTYYDDNVWKFDEAGLLNFPDNTELGQIEGNNTFGFYTTNTNMEYLLEAGDATWNFNAGTRTLELPNGAKIVSTDVTQILGLSTDVTYYNYDAANMTVAVTPGNIVNFPNFSGQVLINDHVSGGVDLWLAGGGSTVLLGHTTVATGSLAENAGISGYSWTSAVTGTMVIVATRTRNSN